MVGQPMETRRDGMRDGMLSDWLRNTRRIGGIAGIIFVVVFAVGIVVSGDTPMVNDDIEEIRAFWTDSGDTDSYLVGDWLTAVAFLLFFLPFLSALRSVLGPADPSGGMWARTAFGAGLVLVGLGGAASMANGALGLGQAEGLDDSTLRFVTDATAYGFGVAAPLAIAATLVPASLVILATGVLWRWLGILGLVVALAGVVGALWVVDGDQESFLGVLGFIAFVGLGVWILATSVAMLMSDRRDRGDRTMA